MHFSEYRGKLLTFIDGSSFGGNWADNSEGSAEESQHRRLLLPIDSADPRGQWHRRRLLERTSDRTDLMPFPESGELRLKGANPWGLRSFSQSGPSLEGNPRSRTDVPPGGTLCRWTPCLSSGSKCIIDCPVLRTARCEEPKIVDFKVKSAAASEAW